MILFAFWWFCCCWVVDCFALIVCWVFVGVGGFCLLSCDIGWFGVWFVFVCLVWFWIVFLTFSWLDNSCFLLFLFCLVCYERVLFNL